MGLGKVFVIIISGLIFGNMPCGFSRLWWKTLEPERCSGHIQSFGLTTRNVYAQLFSNKCLSDKSNNVNEYIDIKDLVVNRVSPFPIKEYLSEVDICKFHLDWLTLRHPSFRNKTCQVQDCKRSSEPHRITFEISSKIFQETQEIIYKPITISNL